MRKYIFIVLLTLLLPASLFAHTQQKEMSGFIIGQVKNALNHTLLEGASLTLMTQDSTIIARDTTAMGKQSFDMRCCYFFEVAADMPDYIIKAEMDGYEPAYLNLPAKKVKGTGLRIADPILLKRQPKTVNLGEVVVKATKVKFYNKGDTLVFNADAFQLSDGSMLDALIRQLPGVELKDNGQIYVNGKYVESMLLNGEDFFNKNNQIMLDNLPAYMVQNVKVYHRSDFMSEALAKKGRKKADDPMVMDVHLKRQYEIGWIGYAEAGGGTHDRWLGRLFASRFTPHSRISAFANMNNLNDARRPGENTNWTPETMPTGEKTQRMAGIDYNIKEKDDVYKLSGDFTVSHNDASLISRNSTETYLADNNSWTRAQSQARNHNWNIATQHKWEWRQNMLNRWRLNASLKYDRWRNRLTDVSAIFNADPSLSVSNPVALLDSISSPVAGNLLRRIAANRYLENVRQTGRHLVADGSLNLAHFLNEGLTDCIYLWAIAKYDGQTARNYSQYRLDYPSAPSLAADYRNRYSLGKPNRTTTYTGDAVFEHWIDDIQYIDLEYKFSVTRLSHDYQLYRLDQLAGYGADDNSPLGSLPSMSDYERTIDLQNSAYRTQTDVTNELTLSYNISRWRSDNNDIQLVAMLPITLNNANMDYRQATYDGSLHRRTLFLNPYFQVLKMWNHQQCWIDFRYRLTNESPDLVRFIDVANNENPLSITRGNPGLLNSRTHYFKLACRLGETDREIIPFFEAWLYDNKIAMGRTYNSTTGATAYRPYNVDGNRFFRGSLRVWTPLGKAKHLVLTNDLGASVSRNVDLMTVVASGEMDATPQKSIVTTQSAVEDLKLTYQLPKLTIGLNGRAQYYHTESHRADFTNQHAWMFNYGPTLKATLPWGFKLATDLQVYSRRGLIDESANSDDVVWNARLSKSIPKTSLTFLVDAFDILHQLSNRTVTMNYQGRTETFRNVLPNYVLFHIIYRFSKKPKKL